MSDSAFAKITGHSGRVICGGPQRVTLAVALDLSWGTCMNIIGGSGSLPEEAVNAVMAALLRHNFEDPS